MFIVNCEVPPLWIRRFEVPQLAHIIVCIIVIVVVAFQPSFQRATAHIIVCLNMAHVRYGKEYYGEWLCADCKEWHPRLIWIWWGPSLGYGNTPAGDGTGMRQVMPRTPCRHFHITAADCPRYIPHGRRFRGFWLGYCRECYKRAGATEDEDDANVA